MDNSDNTIIDVKESNSVIDAQKLASIICNGAIGVLETDTIYGLVGSAMFPDVVSRIYRVKQRNINKPLIILISDIAQLKIFGVDLNENLIEQLKQFWPGPCSIILPISDPQKFDYLTRGGDSLCFRMPKMDSLFELIDLTGPLVAPSANPEELPPAKTIDEAYQYSGDTIDFYSDGGFVDRGASRIIKFDNGNLVELRS